MSGQIGQTRTFRLEYSLPFHHFPELLTILTVLSNNFPELEA